jgi:phosphoglycolate phosphatase
MNATNILFDLDGTISDPKEGITKSIAYALKELGHTPPSLEELTVFIGPPLRQAFKTLMNDPKPEKIEQAMKFYRQRYGDEGRGMVENILYPAIPETLAVLKEQGKRLFIATSKATDIAEKVVSHFELSDLFVKVYGAEIDGTRSDKTELIAYLLANEKITPKDAVMIGDRKHDIIGAAKNGVSGIGALWGYGSAEELREAGATALCKTPEDLSKLI